MPDALDINRGNVVAIVDRQIEIDRAKESDIVEALLLFGMVRTFPCKAKHPA